MHGKLVGRSAPRSCGTAGVSTRCARPPRRYGPSDSPPFCKGDFFEFASTQRPRSERVYVPHGQPRPSTVYAAAAVLWVTAAADGAGKALASQAEGWSAIYCRPGCEVGAPLRCRGETTEPSWPSRSRAVPGIPPPLTWWWRRHGAGALPRLICYRASIVASEFLLPKEGTMLTISPQARQELVAAVAERYQRSTPAERGRILDEFVALTGYHRKHAIRVLNGSSAMPAVRRGRRSVYDEAVTEGLVVLWEASDRVCGKRLKALLPTLVPALAVSPPVVSCLPIRSERPKALLRHRAQTPIRTTWLPTQRHRSRSGRSGPRSRGPASVSTRCARPSLRYGPAGDTPSVPRLRWQLWALRPGLDGGVPAVHDAHGTRQTAGFRMARRTGTGWKSASNGGDKPAGLAPRGAHGVACAGTSGRRWRLHQGRGRPCCSPQTHTNADLRARSTPRAAACSAPE